MSSGRGCGGVVVVSVEGHQRIRPTMTKTASGTNRPQRDRPNRCGVGSRGVSGGGARHESIADGGQFLLTVSPRGAP
jgi:hypothetical protein